MDTAAPLWHLSATSQIVAGSIFGAAFIAAVVYMVRVAVRTRTRYPLFMIIGGALCVIVEPFVDVLGHCMFPVVDMPIWLDAFGRGIPLYMAPVYTVYFGAAALYIMQRIAGGITQRQWWKMCVTTVVIFWMFEPIPIHFQMWTYFGDNQPLQVLGLPLWWAPVNFAADVASATLFAVLLRHRYLTDRFSPALIVLLPVVATGFHTVSALPVYAALNSSDSVVVTTLGALLSIAVAVTVMTVCGRIATSSHSGRPEVAEKQPQTLTTG